MHGTSSRKLCRHVANTQEYHFAARSGPNGSPLLIFRAATKCLPCQLHLHFYQYDLYNKNFPLTTRYTHHSLSGVVCVPVSFFFSPQALRPCIVDGAFVVTQ